MQFDAVERAQLCDLFDELGPDAPTLLAPWTTRDLAAHLVVREHDPIAAPGLVLPGAWGRLGERHRLAQKTRPFDELVATVRSGPPRGFFRLGWVRRVANLNEFFVHHEDVRRANGRVAPRVHPPGEEDALWKNAVHARWLLARRLRDVSLELAWPDADRVVRTRGDRPIVRVSGPPGELLLFLFGRVDAAAVDITGPSEAVEAVQITHFGM
ncbi:MAG TPA: TIGR03085 family metal-binding protein [Acidimicrobiia bacterium]|nr:TIGR03085 family metal-binding protein [Acidimicrobiia bacterium]